VRDQAKTPAGWKDVHPLTPTVIVELSLFVDPRIKPRQHACWVGGKLGIQLNYPDAHARADQLLSRACEWWPLPQAWVGHEFDCGDDP
jgi:hypothetical protein